MACWRLMQLHKYGNGSTILWHKCFCRRISSQKYADTLNLPSTQFPLRANASIREVEIQKSSGFNDLYAWQEQRKTDKTFCLHDGPPYANGDLHIGHVLNKVLKDIINRYKVMQGYKVHYKPGWDCHGLPIELKATSMEEITTKSMSALQIRRKAKSFAEKTLKTHKKSFQRWGIMANWNDVYKTIDKEYEANQLLIFYKMYQKGCIYRGYKPVFWSPSSKTALADAELEYHDYVSRAIYVKFPVSFHPGSFLFEGGDDLYVLIWTTTPWTIPFNEAICYNPSLRYCVVKDKKTGEQYILCADLLQSVQEIFSTKFDVVVEFDGKQLNGVICQHPLYMDKASHLLPAKHVTTDSGTGLVHTAPSHGIEDYKIGQKYGLPSNCAVDENGLFTDDAGTEFAGKSVLDQGNAAVIELLRSRGNLSCEEDYCHRYPHDWRTGKPVILRATKQWFAKTTDLIDQAKTSISQIVMYPAASRRRLLSTLGSYDWCISRQRYWGLPIPVFYDNYTDEPYINESSVRHVTNLIKEHGSDCWWELPVTNLFPKEISRMFMADPETLRRGEDTMDVWFDSGTSWATVLKDQDCVADLYLEGSDQHRGWFHSSLITSLAAQSKPPYRGLLTHGFVVDGNYRKMSKSLGNIVHPDDAIVGTKGKNGLGVDVLRLWVASSDYSSDLSCSNEILQRHGDSLRKIRNSARFILGNLNDFKIATDQVNHKDLLEIDRYMFHRLLKFHEDVTTGFDEMLFAQATRSIFDFVNNDLAIYFDAIKDRLYAEDPTSRLRRSAQTSLYHILNVLVGAIAPITPHLAEEICSFGPVGFVPSVFKSNWHKVCNDWEDNDLDARWSFFREVRDTVNKCLSSARIIARESQVNIKSFEKVFNILAGSNTMDSEINLGYSPLNELFATSATQIELLNNCSFNGYTEESIEDGFIITSAKSCDKLNLHEEWVQVQVKRATGLKCPRCWKLTSSDAGNLCERCLIVISNQYQ